MSQQRQDDIAKLDELIKDIEIAMMTTLDEHGHLHARPMATQREPFEGELWFFTDSNSPKVHQIQHDNRVNIAYSAPEKNRYVSVAGTATLITDKSVIETMWKPILKAWFPDGPETPGIALLKIDVESAEYWDSPSSTIVKLAGLVKATVTRQRIEGGENEKIDLK
jgi:general stress protein 26